MIHRITLVASLAALFLAACQTAPKTDAAKKDLLLRAQAAVETFKTVESSTQNHFDTAEGYAVFPQIGKGGFIFGGAYGKGVLYEKDEHVGYCDVSQGSIGAQIGGQGYMEVIFFETKETLESFKSGEFALAAQASGVAAKTGGAVAADYVDGVAIFTRPLGGLMGEASIGGQNFTYQPK